MGKYFACDGVVRLIIVWTTLIISIHNVQISNIRDKKNFLLLDAIELPAANILIRTQQDGPLVAEMSESTQTQINE